MRKAFTCLFIVLSFFSKGQVRCGADCTGNYFSLLKDKNIGVVANPASMISKTHLVDSLVHSGIRVSVIFSPEHGFRKYAEAGVTVGSSIDSATRVPVVSLYGKQKKPSPAEMKNLDLVVFDLQDVGVRFFTYISTLTYVMEACAENNVPMLLLDRPDPNGFYVDGPVLEEPFASFVGLHPVPVVYGMTIGEYAQMVNGEGWLKNGVICDLQVIPLENWTHRTRYQLPVRPSPNLQDMNAVYLYPSLCLFEGTIISVGRGTPYPFEVFGHPELKGFSFYFKPEVARGGNPQPPYKGMVCMGLDLRNFYSTHPKLMGRINLAWLFMAYQDMGSTSSFFNDYFDKLAGNSTLRNQVMEDLPDAEIRKTWQPGLDQFREIRKKYLIYPD
jgi:uncharacterized protein YbbC (DUF1343 family)